jgi:ribulose-phosphate 3-epimerase
MSKVKVAPSILSADFSCLGAEIRSVEKLGADLLHIDVMDGHFVPNITIGPAVVRSIRKVTRLPLDVHLMIEDPGKYIGKFADAGADMITVHIEAVSSRELGVWSKALKKRKVKFGLSLNPATPLKKILPGLKYADFVLVMSVVPGFGGQAFIPSALAKIRLLRSVFRGDIAVDGGINDRTARLAANAGANILAAGSYIFQAKNRRQAIERIRNAGD